MWAVVVDTVGSNRMNTKATDQTTDRMLTCSTFMYPVGARLCLGRLIASQEVGLPSLKMTPRSLAAALAVAPSDTSSRWTEAMLGIYRMLGAYRAAF